MSKQPQDTNYTIQFVNNSGIDGQNAVVFQQAPTVPSDVHTLAWLTAGCDNGGYVDLTWSLDYSFVWGRTGTLQPGVSYQVGGSVPADPQGNNVVTLDYDTGNGSLHFNPDNAVPGAPLGSLLIQETNLVPINGGCVGIGMSGAGTFVVPTSPTSGGGVQFTPTPTYSIAWGTYEAGIVVDTSILLSPTPISFPPGQPNAKATFDGTGFTLAYSELPFGAPDGIAG